MGQTPTPAEIRAAIIGEPSQEWLMLDAIIKAYPFEREDGVTPFDFKGLVEKVGEAFPEVDWEMVEDAVAQSSPIAYHFTDDNVLLLDMLDVTKILLTCVRGYVIKIPERSSHEIYKARYSAY